MVSVLIISSTQGTHQAKDSMLKLIYLLLICMYQNINIFLCLSDFVPMCSVCVCVCVYCASLSLDNLAKRLQNLKICI